jgi:hypothetical protein
MMDHVKQVENWNGESQLVLGYLSKNPNVFAGSMESIRVTLCTSKKKKNGKEVEDTSVDIRRHVASDSFTGVTKQGFRLSRQGVVELLSIMPEIREALEIDEEDIKAEIEERNNALTKKKE